MRRLFLNVFVALLLLGSSCWAGVLFDNTDDAFCKNNPTTSTMPSQHPLTITAILKVGGGSIFEYGERDGSASGFKIGVSGTGLLYTTFDIKDYVSNTISLTAAGWFFIAVSVDSADDATFYAYDYSTGVWTASSLVTHNADMNAPSAASDLIIGALHSAVTGDTCTELGAFSLNTIEEVAVYNTNLSSDTLKNLATRRVAYSAINPLLSSLKGYWVLNAGADGASADGFTLLDSLAVNNLTGIDGANNTGLTWAGQSAISYPSSFLSGQ